MIGLGAALLAGCVRREVVYAPAPPPPAATVAAPEPPPPQVEVVPPQPDVTFIWIPGAWAWRGHWIWVAGRWAPPPHRGAVWVGAHWERHGHGRVWVEGRWR